MPRGDGSRPENSRKTLSAAESLAQSEEMFTLRCAGWTVRDIARKFGVSGPCVSTRINRYRKDHVPVEKRANRRADIDELYRKQLRRVEEIIDYGPIPAYSSGRAIATQWDDNGKPIEYALDYSYVLTAINTAMKITAEIRKMYGLDEPTKVEQSGTVTFELVGVDLGDV